LGETVHDALISLGAFSVFAGRLFRWLLVSVPRWKTLMPNLYQVGVRSLPVVALTGTFIGMVLSVQSYAQFRQLGLETRLGAVINLSLVRELGPVLAATMLAGRVGSAMAAELGTMRVTEQIDALSVMGVNPIKFLVVPRFLACFFMIPILTIMADFMGVCGGFFYSVIILGIDSFHYLENSAVFVTGFDLLSGIAKSVFFGGAIALVSCYQGFNSEGGAEGVGKAATSSFVYSFVSILVLDLFLGIVIQNLQEFLYPGGAKLL
jgi:phospholipid/cholesterol/gamma-HCH transport system permease protein